MVCPFHKDNGPSLAINLAHGGAKCHASSCEFRAGNIVHFESKLAKQDERVAARALYYEFVRRVIDPQILAGLTQNIRKFGTAVGLFMRDTGLSLSTISRFDIGYDEHKKRFVFPILSPTGEILNFRLYKTPSMRGKDTKVKIMNLDGYGGMDLFPWVEAVEYRKDIPVFLMSCEREVMLARQAGLQAVCSTTGEGSWSEEWNEWASNYHIVTVMDSDKGGESATKRLKQILADVAKSVKSISLTFRRKECKDFADWVLVEKNRASDLHKLIPADEDTSKIDVESDSASSKPSPAKGKTHDLYDISSNPKLLGVKVTVSGLVSTKASRTYHIPYEFKVKAKNRTPFVFKIPIGRELASFVRGSDEWIRSVIGEMIGNVVQSFEPLKSVQVSEVEVIPIAVADKDSPYVVQPCFAIGVDVGANIPYEMDIVPISDMRHHSCVGLIVAATELSSSMDTFDVDEHLQSLQKFQPEADVWSHCMDIVNDLAVNYTKIYDRPDWHLAALLTWMSPLHFRFPNEDQLQRGWMNTLTVGDTQTGKSEVAKKFISTFEAGVFASAENCTLVGMVGGAIKMASGAFGLRWGRIPLGDRRLVVLEELTGLSQDDIACMSDVRSSGVAKLDKGGISGETNARTRLLCLSNPRSRQPLSNFLFGIVAAQGVVGQPEDLSRFDLVLTLVDSEVSNRVINGKPPKSNLRFKREEYQALCKFAWSLKGEQVSISDKAADRCKFHTLEMSKKYHPSVPVFKGGSGRFKLARIASAIAVICFSYRAGKLVVKTSHVDAARRLLEMCYDKPSFGYDVWSRQLFDKERIILEDELRKMLHQHIVSDRFSNVVKSLIYNLSFTRDELCAYAGVSITVADSLISVMCSSHVISKGLSNSWAITPSGKRWLSQEIQKYV